MDARPDGTQPPSAPSRRIEISLTQLLAGSAAAACGAWLASKIGVAGTVIGAAIVSALVTTLSAIYTHGARRAQERLLVRKAEIHERARLPATYADDPPPPAPEPPAEGYRWGRIALAALAVFIVAMGAVTVIELVKGQSFSCSSAGRDCDQGTTLLPGRARTHPTSPTPTLTPSATTTPSVVPSSGSGTPSPTGSPSPSVSTTGSPSPSGTPSGTVSPSASATTG